MAKLDAGGARSAGDIKESNRVEAEGHFMVFVKEVKYNDKDPEASKDIIETEVVGGTVPGQSGKEVTMFLDRKPNGDFSEKRHVRFAIATGLMQPGQVVDVDDDFFCGAKDRYLVVRIEKTKKGGFFVGGFGDDMWPINDPEMAEIIRAMDGKVPAILQRMAQQAGQNATAQQQARPAQPAPIQTPPEMANAASSSVTDGWDV